MDLIETLVVDNKTKISSSIFITTDAIVTGNRICAKWSASVNLLAETVTMCAYQINAHGYNEQQQHAFITIVASTRLCFATTICP